MAMILHMMYVTCKPRLSPKNPTPKTILALTPKLIDMYMLFIKVGMCELVLWTVAIRTGPVANKNIPTSGKRKIVSNQRNSDMLITIPKLATTNVVFRPILSDIFPARKTPIMPNNCNTEIEIPAYQRVSPWFTR